MTTLRTLLLISAFIACGFATGRAQTAPASAPATTQPLAVRAEVIYTMSGEPIKDGRILLRDGKIEKVGKAADVQIPADVRTLTAKVVTPGLIDAHTIVGLQGYLNEPREQDQLEKSAPMQPDLRAMDAFNGREKLLEWIRGFGVTTIHTGPQPGELIPGQTMIIKTRGPEVDDGLIKPTAMLSITLGEGAIQEEKGKSPGTRAKELAMLRGEFIKAREYEKKMKRAATRPTTASSSDDDKTPPRDLQLDVILRALHKELPVLITAHKAQDILAALKLAKEFDLKLVLDGCSESYLLIDQIKAASVPVIIHPTMYRSSKEAENLSMETASKLHAAGIPIALQSGYEGYVPKTRVVLFEAAIAAANGMSFTDALATITSDAAKILGIQDRVGTIEAGKDADLALFDGDPFEYTTHCVGTVTDGQVVSEEKR
jgi:imidazolonepropionase-like amidohydrolase